MNKLFLAMAVMGLLSVVIGAQPAKRGGSFPMERADANRDGQISWGEVRKIAPRFTQKRFNKMDRNGDGVLSKADLARDENRARSRMPEGERLLGILRRADTNGDQRVTKAELSDAAPRLARGGVAKLDTNNDGVISEADLKRRAQSGGPSPQAVWRADANGDGFWSYEELKTVAKRLSNRVYKNADGDGDGLLNQKELRTLRQVANRSRGNTRTAGYSRDSVAKMLESDTNGDGSVTFDELVAAKPGFPRANFDRNDRNNDGVVSNADRP